MPPQITCPHCGSTINLENRKEVDFEKIIYALNHSPKTFTELLDLTNLPRKTLSLRLKDLCTSGSIIKDGGYRLSSSIKPAKKIFGKRNGNGKMNKTMMHVGKNVQWIPAALIVCLVIVAFGSAVLLSPPPPGPAAPSATFSVGSPSGFVVSRPLTFDASLSKDSDGYITSYIWDFGDGATAPSVSVTHAYSQEGKYTVTLFVTDNDQLADSATRLLTIGPEPPKPTIRFTILPDPNAVDAGWEDKWMVNRPLTFDASAFDEASGYEWDFGDGAVATGVVVSHAYQEPGTYNAVLTVTDKAGLHTITEQVTILSMPTTTIYVDPLPTEYHIGDIITLNIMISDVTDLWAWQSGMTFNPTVLECMTTTYVFNGTSVPTAFAEGEFLKRGGTTMGYIGTVDNGVITIHGFSLYGDNAVPVSGSGVLATVTFKVIGEGALNIHLTDVILTNIDESGTPIDIPVYVAT
jgi:PKD repeat protein